MSWISVCFRLATLFAITNAAAGYGMKAFECGPYGFICEPNNKIRICEGDNILGPSFLCPPNTVCNEDSSDVCENASNYLGPGFTRAVHCQRSERIADPSVPNCKGYILCIPNKNRYQGIRFTCSGNTIFNGYSRTCSAPERYRCPLTNNTKTPIQLFSGNRRVDTNRENIKFVNSKKDMYSKVRPIDCKNYKFSVTQDNSPVRATYFCPSRPIRGEVSVRCTIFSNQFCITLERDDEDQFIQENGAAYRKPRM